MGRFTSMPLYVFMASALEIRQSLILLCVAIKYGRRQNAICWQNRQTESYSENSNTTRQEKNGGVLPPLQKQLHEVEYLSRRYVLVPQPAKEISCLSWNTNISRFIKVSKVFYMPNDAREGCFKRILLFAWKRLLHVSVQSPSSGSVLFEFAKVIVIKIIS
jgi:hypothetical protein